MADMARLVPGERFELPTNGLQNRCSTTELTRHFFRSIRHFSHFQRPFPRGVGAVASVHAGERAV
jgi:hypothetical protein